MHNGDFGRLKDFDELQDIELPEKLPILPLRQFIVFPHMVTPLIIARDKSLKLIENVMNGNKLIGLVAQKDAEEEEPSARTLYRFGTAGYVLKKLIFPDNSVRVLTQGISRIRINRFVRSDPFFVAKISTIHDTLEKDIEIDALTSNISIQFQKMITLVPTLPEELQIAIMNIDDPGKLADLLISNLNVSLQEKQEILEAENIRERLLKLTVMINREMQVLEMGSKIQFQVQSEINKNQREFFLREQLKAIQQELGETDDKTSELNELKQKIEQSGMPEKAQEEALRELTRLKKIMPGSAEYTVARTYLDWLVNMPWQVSTQDNADLDKAEKILNADHFGLADVKERILEFLAVRKINQRMKGPILCFMGPPGVGKTSLGQSIARALNRKFIRISLGGMKDEAEIRGHRRTYIGALPGRIIRSIHNVGANNPVFMLDEIDKIGQDFHGDPSSALLEALDPEQNFSFSDHYLDVPFDLSKVMFITTANYPDPIPPALKDRLEIIELPGYTVEEKLVIATRHLLPKQLESHGLAKKHLTIQKKAIRKIIQDYTREAGVRNLDRELAKIFRKVARKQASGENEKITITPESLKEFLGPEKFYSEISDRVSEPGIATGLAWTPYGGEILFVECTLVKGAKGLMLTGQMGDVMKESAQAALTYVRANSSRFGLNKNDFEDTQFHIHVPAGAIPKDGPSAGVTMVVALLSLLTKKRVNPKIAMTGEITLRGKILPVGGIKEKLLAARRAHIKEVVLPAKNTNDLIKLPEPLQKQLKIHLVEKIDEAVKFIFG
ncbi:MAG: endopeptidase La [Calditrichaeota bacterium]|nr:endopeptidase La [Calditrichota bacterium]